MAGMATIASTNMDIVDDAEHQQAVQPFLDELRPWLHPGDCPHPRATFTVFSEMELAPDTAQVAVVFTSEGLAFFRQGLGPVMGTS